MTQNIWNILADSFMKILIPGLTMTIPLTLLAFGGALVIAVITALIQYAKVPVLKDLARVYIWIIRGTPLLVQLYVVFFGLPSIGVKVQAFPAAVIVFAINEGAYCAETMRAAIEAVPRGQLEAGYCSGLSFVQVMWHIVLPQAFRTAFPPLFNSLIGMVKDTSLASNITVAEMFFAAQRIAGRTYQFMAIYLELAFIYLMFSTVLSRIQAWGEKKLASYGGVRK
ncbi:amino acid ABC transporter permease [Erysipelotrichaceae bacterium Oil+RF-744-GAM-WT-6]|jgi:cystine transport system permease protein|uniref:Amino acid ABC transporter permease n=1 Tax=Stecheria intestinalis TaxID=2606630 RepID=A0A7X2TFY2_9FIRM|nr:MULTISPECIES: amino acid ABC transporter permease [Erysipelotrichaceae]MCI2153718.1 amino acid ABC transporter permease [Solobacterium sp.]MDY3234914.1 amino acid ABC transporter permease [Erysipelotrichaceae bacterium]MDY4681376.1 amino acid ABC transporter permease [Lachnospiraceae bacterium]MCI6744945.1 amino acid ABC transporter permease [Anaerolactibacter massiliensis]MDD5880889.1 amino acid ABC transporter permease [Stecheria intestinalis]